MQNNKMYIVVRSDLTIGEQLAQSNHASFIFGHMYPDLTLNWLENSNYIAVLQIENESKLRSLLRDAAFSDIKFVVFEEPDMNNSLTAICLEPSERSKKLCAKLKLAGL